MSLADAYEHIAGRLLDLADDLTDEEIERIVPATPAWTVRQTYAHLAGAAADVAAGHLTGMGTEPWTAAHVADRDGMTMEAICAEWTTRAPAVIDRVAASGDSLIRIVTGTWTHEQDIRGAVGLQGLASGRGIDVALDLVPDIADRLPDGAPTLRIEVPGRQWVIGTGPVGATLSTDPFTLARVISSRRTPGQIAELPWKGDPTPFLGHLGAYGECTTPLDV